MEQIDKEKIEHVQNDVARAYYDLLKTHPPVYLIPAIHIAHASLICALSKDDPEIVKRMLDLVMKDLNKNCEKVIKHLTSSQENNMNNND